MATKYKHEIKKRIDATAADSSVRGISQVLSCSAIAVALSLFNVWCCGGDQPVDFTAAPLSSSVTCGIVAHYATCLGDTLASELGIVSEEAPILISRPWRRVPPGTNGGVTLLGTLWSLFGGAIIGAFNVAMDLTSGATSRNYVIPMIVFGASCGLLGSLIDSLLGATLQISYWDPEAKTIHHEKPPTSSKFPVQHVAGVDLLNNVQVNLISVAITTFLGGWFLAPLVFQSGYI